MAITYEHIYQNSYIVSAVVLVILLLIFYLFDIGSKTTIESDGSIRTNFNWKLPLAITLIFWVVWHFFVFPPIQDKKIVSPKKYDSINSVNPPVVPSSNKTFGLRDQQINRANWY